MNRTQYTLAAIALVITMTLALAFGSQGRKQPVRTSDIGTPAMVTPEPTPRPLTLTLDLPAMDPDQAYWYHQAQIVSLRDGVSATDRTLWLALLWTETGYRPWECSELGACGLGQLYGSLRSPETDADPIRNLSVRSGSLMGSPSRRPCSTVGSAPAPSPTDARRCTSDG